TPVENADISTSTNRFSSSTNIQYDDAGNIISDSKFTLRQYKYDAMGRQWWSAYLDNSGVSTAVYDGAGQRVQSTSYGTTAISVYDIFGQLVAEYGNAQQGVGGTHYILSDQQDSTRVVTDSSGNVIARHDFQSFGGDISSGVGLRTISQGYSATDTTRQQYAGLERDNGLNHATFRKYDNSSGRWSSPDPYGGSMSISDPQSFNRYAYVGNDPVNGIDPSGLDWFSDNGFDASMGGFVSEGMVHITEYESRNHLRSDLGWGTFYGGSLVNDAYRDYQARIAFNSLDDDEKELWNYITGSI